MEKHGSRSWTQRATACLCLAAHNFHILYRSAAPRSLSASETGSEGSERGTHAPRRQHEPQRCRSAPRRSAKATGRKGGKSGEATAWVGQEGAAATTVEVVEVVVHQLFPSSRECLSSRKKKKKKKKNYIVQMMRHTGVKVVVVMGREEGRGATV